MRFPGKIFAAALSASLLLGGALPASALAEPPDEAGALRRAWTAVDAWDVPGARRVLDELDASSPSGNAARSEARLKVEARVLFEETRLDEAAAAAEQIPEASRDSLLRLILDTHALTQGHLTAESEHFRFRYPPGRDALLVPYALETLEKIHGALAGALGHTPPTKVTVEIYPSADALSRVTTLPLEAIRTTGTVAICKFGKLMAVSPRTLIQGYDWRDTLAHEYVHLVVSQVSGDRVPVWVHEGLAKYFETAWRTSPGQGMSPASAAFLVQEAKKNALIPFEKMHPSLALLPSQEDAALAYAEAFTAIEHLASSSGTEALGRLLSAYREGADDARAFKAASGRPFPSFVAAWKSAVRRRTIAQEAISLDAEKRRFGTEDAERESSEDRAGEDRRRFQVSDFPDLKDAEARRRAHLGELLRVRGKSAAAVTEFEQALKIAGNTSPMLSNRCAQALWSVGDGASRTKAFSLLNASRALFPGQVRTLKNLGAFLMEAGRMDEAEDALLRVVGIDPFDPAPHESLLKIYEKSGRTDRAGGEAQALKILGGELFAWPDSSGTNAGRTEISPDMPPVRLTVESRPFADVEVDGVPTGRSTPATLLLPPGTHQIRVTNPAYGLDRKQEVFLPPGAPQVVRMTR